MDLVFLVVMLVLVAAVAVAVVHLHGHALATHRAVDALRVRLILADDAAGDVDDEPTPVGWLEAMTSRRLRVHTVAGQTVEGLLEREAPDGLVLVHARWVGPTSTELAGQVWLPRVQVAMVQEVVETA